MSKEPRIVTVRRDNARDLIFGGELVAQADDAIAHNERDRWTLLQLYRTVGGKWIANRVCFDRWRGEAKTREAVVLDADNEAGAIAFFGLSDLAKELYDAAAIGCCEQVD